MVRNSVLKKGLKLQLIVTASWKSWFRPTIISCVSNTGNAITQCIKKGERKFEIEKKPFNCLALINSQQKPYQRLIRTLIFLFFCFYFLFLFFFQKSFFITLSFYHWNKSSIYANVLQPLHTHTHTHTERERERREREREQQQKLLHLSLDINKMAAQ